MSDGKIRNGILPLPVPWTSDGSGDASVTIPNYHGYLLLSAKTAPGEDGDLATDLPTDLYDVVINDAYSEDIMNGNLADRSGTVAKAEYAIPAIPIISALTVVVSNAGDTKQGLVLLTFEQN